MSTSTTKPGQVPHQIMEFLRSHPGQEFRPSDVGRAIGVSTHHCAVAMLSLADRGLLVRRRHTRTRSMYRAA